MAAAAQRIHADLRTPADHFLALVTQQRNDHLLWARGRKQSDGREWYKLNAEVAVQELSRYTNEPDIFITPNEFYGWRLVRLLAGLNAFFVDIDVHGGQADPVATAMQALSTIESARLPQPNMIVYTGRGAHLYWLFSRTPKHALPRWQLVQKTLAQLVAGDKQAIDVTRILRVVGTTNPQAPKARRLVTAEVLNPERYDFDWLCDQIVQLPRAEIRDLRAARAKKGARSGEDAGERQKSGSIYTVWYHRYQDMIRICDAYWFGGVPPGKRDFVLFHMANALSWFTRSEALYDEILAVARHHIQSFTEPEIRSYTTSVVKRALDAAAGKRYEWNGQYVDPRYRMSAERMWEDWKDLVLGKPELIPQLRAIVPPEVREEREQARQQGRDRIAEGRYKTDRAAYLSEAAKNRSEALELAAQGLSWEEIGQRLGIAADAARMRAKRAAAKQSGECPTPNKSAPLVYAITAQNDPEKRAAEAARLRSEGQSVRQIAEIMGISKSTVDRLLKCPAPNKSAPLA